MELTHIKATLAGPVLDVLMATWQELAQEHAATGQYGASESFQRVYPYEGDELAGALANTAPHAHVLEHGHQGVHLPSAIDWGAAMGRGTAKRSKRGTYYLRVPFRHMTPGSEHGGIGAGRARTMMPVHIYRDALKMLRGDDAAAARVDAGGTLLSRPYGAMRAAEGLPPRAVQDLHRLTEAARAREGQPGYTWRNRLYEGLQHSQQRNPVTGASSGMWQTMRTLSSDSVGWYVPPVAGYHIAERAVERARPQIEALLGEAARADAVQLLTIALGQS